MVRAVSPPRRSSRAGFLPALEPHQPDVAFGGGFGVGEGAVASRVADALSDRVSRYSDQAADDSGSRIEQGDAPLISKRHPAVLEPVRPHEGLRVLVDLLVAAAGNGVGGETLRRPTGPRPHEPQERSTIGGP